MEIGPFSRGDVWRVGYGNVNAKLDAVIVHLKYTAQLSVLVANLVVPEVSL